MSGPPAPPPSLMVPPPPSALTMRGSTVTGALSPPIPNNLSGPQGINSPSPFNTNTIRGAPPQLQRQATVAQVPPTAEELGVKFVDTGREKPITEEDRAGWKSFRSKVAGEVLTTERSYVQSLSTMIKAYHDPYFDGVKTGLTDKKVAALFTLPKVIVAVATSFLAEIEIMIAKWDQDEVIAPTFIKFAPMFRTYRDYSSAHQQTITTILGKINSRSAFTGFQEKQMRALMCQDLASYLIMPIQRLPRYKLLLESLISKTESTHPQSKDLLSALKLISEVATSVNDAMKAALLVERYMHVQKMFSGELVHLWRKLLHEFPCRVSRVWSPTTPAKESTKDKKDKREKKHRFVGNDAVIFLFTDCIWIGVKTKDREKKYEDTRNSPDPYPLYADDFSYKFSSLTLGVHALSTTSLSQPLTVADHSYHHSLVLTSPVHGICVSFDTHALKENAQKLIIGSMTEFEQLSRNKTLTNQNFSDVPSNGKVTDVLCCDRCQIGLSHYQKLSADFGAYNVIHNHLSCNRCMAIVCTSCLHEDPMFEKPNRTPQTPAGGSKFMPFSRQSAVTPSPSLGPKSMQILGKEASIPSYQSQLPVHTGVGWGVCPASGRWCKVCQSAPPVTDTPKFDANDRESISRKSYIGGGTLSAEDLQSIRARKNNDVGLKINTNGDLDLGPIPLPLPTPSSRSNNENPNELVSPSTPSHNAPSTSVNNGDGNPQFNTGFRRIREKQITGPQSSQQFHNTPEIDSSLSLNTPSTNTNNNNSSSALGGNATPASPSVNNLSSSSSSSSLTVVPPASTPSFNKPPESPVSTSRPPAFNSIRSFDSLAMTGSALTTSAATSSTSPPPFAGPSGPSTAAATPNNGPTPPPFNPRASSVAPPPFSPSTAIFGTNTSNTPASPTPPLASQSSAPPPLPPGASPQMKFSTSPPVPPPSVIVQQKQQQQQDEDDDDDDDDDGIDTSDDDIPPPPVINFNLGPKVVPPTPIIPPDDDDDGCPPPPPTVGCPVEFDPKFTPTSANSNSGTTGTTNTTQPLGVPPPPPTPTPTPVTQFGAPPPPDADSDDDHSAPPPPPPATPRATAPSPRSFQAPPPQPPQQVTSSQPPPQPPQQLASSQPPPQPPQQLTSSQPPPTPVVQTAFQPPTQPAQPARSNALAPKALTRRPSI